MIDSVFAPRMAPYFVNSALTKLYIVLFVDVLRITLQRKTKKSEINYRLKTMLATVNRSSTPFISSAFVGFRFIPFFRQDIVLPALQNSTGQTPKTPIRGNGKGLSGAYKRTLAMRRLLKAVLGIKDITISIGKETGPITSIFDFYSPEPMQQRRGEVTDYQLRLFRAVVYVSIVK